MTFKEAVEEGLSSKPKSISSRYFYDDAGSRLFQLIMKSPDYYLTNCEHEIFTTQTQDIVKKMASFHQELRLIDLGAGDGIKTITLLEEFTKLGIDVVYTPVDISEEAILESEKNIKKKFPGIKVESYIGEYYDALKEIDQIYTKLPKVILFLGSNIGNFTNELALNFLTELNKLCTKNDKLFIGFDLMKNPKIIRRAYNDKLGITKKFNLNLLERINRELGGDFDIDQFDHYNTYDPITGTARSFIVSLRKQQVTIQSLNKTFSFAPFEVIDVEQSQKYDLKVIESLAKGSNFKVLENFFDKKQYYTNSLWEI